MLTLYGWPKTRSVRVAWMLEELGVEYDYKAVNLYKGEHRRAPFTELSRFHRVPLLMTDEGPLSESGAIVNYLGDKFGDGTLVPKAGTYARAQYEQIQQFLLTDLEQSIWFKAKHTFVLPEALRSDAIFPACDYEFENSVKTLLTWLGDSPYLMGESFSAVDIIAGHILNWAKSAGQDVSPVADYLQRVSERPAYRAAWQREQAAAE